MPVLGDTQHGDSQQNRAWGMSRLFLHCWKVEMPSSATIVAPLHDALKDALESIHDVSSEDSLYRMALAKDPLIGQEWIDLRGGTLGQPKPWQRG